MKHVCVVGSIVRDLTFYADALPRPGETLSGDFRAGLGGKGFNQAIAAGRAGAPTTFIGAVGSDEQGAPFVARLEELGISHALECVDGGITGAAGIIVDSAGNNQIVVSLGANLRVSREHIRASRRYLEEASVLVLQCEVGMDAIHEALTVAKSASSHVVTVLNPAPAPREGIPAAVLELVDILTPNETELAVLARADDLSPDDLSWVHASCRRIPFQGEILVTLGARGAYYYTPDLENASESRRIPPYVVEAADTTGAGDAFNGGLAAGLVHAHGERALAFRYASAVAALSVTKRGTSESMPDVREIEALLR